MNIWLHNNAILFTSLGTKVDKSVDGPYGYCCFQISGQLCHHIVTLYPLKGDPASFAQIFIWGGQLAEEANLRAKQCHRDLNCRLLQGFLLFMYNHNPYAKLFRTARNVHELSALVSI